MMGFALTPSGIQAEQERMAALRKSADSGSEGPVTSSYEAARAFMRSLCEEDDQEENDDVAEPDVDRSRVGLSSPADSASHLLKDSGPFPKELAHRGGRVVQGVHVDFVDLQNCRSEALATLQTAGPDASGSSLHSAGGSVAVQALDQATASANQELLGHPSAKPGQPAFASAPSGYGERFSKTPRRPS